MLFNTRYQMERKIFEELLELKRLQIRWVICTSWGEIRLFVEILIHSLCFLQIQYKQNDHAKVAFVAFLDFAPSFIHFIFYSSKYGQGVVHKWRHRGMGSRILWRQCLSLKSKISIQCLCSSFVDNSLIILTFFIRIEIHVLCFFLTAKRSSLF